MLISFPTPLSKRDLLGLTLCAAHAQVHPFHFKLQIGINKNGVRGIFATE